MKIQTTRYIITGGLGLLIIGLSCIVFIFFSLHQDLYRDENPKTSDTKTSTPKTPTANNRSVEESATQKNQQTSTSKTSTAATQASQQIVSIIPSLLSPTFKAKTGEVFPLRTYKTLAANDPNATQWWTSSTGLAIHAVKGQDADRVLLIMSEEHTKEFTDFYKHEKSANENSRLFYVAITRAKCEIVVCIPSSMQTRLLNAINTQTLELSF